MRIRIIQWVTFFYVWGFLSMKIINWLTYNRGSTDMADSIIVSYIQLATSQKMSWHHGQSHFAKITRFVQVWLGNLALRSDYRTDRHEQPESGSWTGNVLSQSSHDTVWSWTLCQNGVTAKDNSGDDSNSGLNVKVSKKSSFQTGKICHLLPSLHPSWIFRNWKAVVRIGPAEQEAL